MILDFLIINSTNFYTSLIILSIFFINDKYLYYLLITDVILNGFPLVTIMIIILNKLKVLILKYIKNNIYTLLFISLLNYYLFGIFIYGSVDFYIIKFLFSNLIINLILYYLSIKYILKKYN